MLYLVLEDFVAGSFSASAGSLLDDSTIDLAPLQAAGLAVVLYDAPTMSASRSAFLAARGTRPSAPDNSGDLVALLLAAGALGDGGITELTGDVLAGPGSGSQAASVVALQGTAISAIPPSADGQVLTWNGSEWVPAAAQVGGSGGGGETFFFNNGLAGDAPLPVAGTKELGLTAEAPLTTVTSGTLPNDGVTFALVAGFVTDLGSPGLLSIPTGLWDFNVWAQAGGPSLQPNTVRFRLRIYVWDGVTATLIATSGTVPLYDPNQLTQYGCSALVPQTPLLATDRIYVAIEATATSNNHTITVSFGDAAPSHVHTSIPITVAVANGGTGLTAVPSNGELLIGNGVGYSLASLTAGTNITITPGPGSITIDAAGGGGGPIADLSLNASAGTGSPTFCGGFFAAGETVTTVKALIWSQNNTTAELRIVDQAGNPLVTVTEPGGTFGWREISVSTSVVLPTAGVYIDLRSVYSFFVYCYAVLVQ